MIQLLTLAWAVKSRDALSVQQLPGAAGAKPDKTLKCIQIADIGQLAHISDNVLLNMANS
jgi:hypothetical protein